MLWVVCARGGGSAGRALEGGERLLVSPRVAVEEAKMMSLVSAVVVVALGGEGEERGIGACVAHNWCIFAMASRMRGSSAASIDALSCCRCGCNCLAATELAINSQTLTIGAFPNLARGR